MLTFIAENCRLNLVKECYNKLRELIVWGYPIALLRLREREFHMEYNDMVAQAGRYLGRGKCGGIFRQCKGVYGTGISGGQDISGECRHPAIRSRNRRVI